MSRRLTLLVLPALLWACSGSDVTNMEGEIPFTPDRPGLGTGTNVAPYTGTNEKVLTAQATYVSAQDLHRKFVLRTCGPTNGVCHNQKEYPDLHTAGTFLAAVGAPCNVQPGSWQSVFDRCERLGDRFRFSGGSADDIEIGWTELVPGEYKDYRPDGERPTETSPGLHIVLREPLPGDRVEQYGTGLFVRTFVDDEGNVQELPFANFTGGWWMLGDRKHLFAEVRDDQQDAVAALLTGGIVQGDHNRNGTFGHLTGTTVSLLNPGRPEESYLVARVRGHMQGQTVPGTRMPLANIPPSVVDMLALVCWLEGLDPAAPPRTLDSQIDYAGCSYSADPDALNVVGTGASWSGRIRPMLVAHCGGCHNATSFQGQLDLVTDNPDTPGDEVHARLLGFSKQRTDVKLIAPGFPEQSYVWRKLNNDGTILGARMPIYPDPTTQLPGDVLESLQTWILAGALPD
ncbi:MAG: hypothetical protein L0Y66_26995 [Myxococcaceae bacterium]|nr:hypothetical protein [Myxococcaceae bacterium]MCI0672795.1 hypothetical protein [Myxococcaceae bacterium]